MLLKEIEDEIPMDELEADIVKPVDYHDVILSLESCATRMMDREQATAIERSSHPLNDVSTHSSRLKLGLTDMMSLSP